MQFSLCFLLNVSVTKELLIHDPRSYKFQTKCHLLLNQHPCDFSAIPTIKYLEISTANTFQYLPDQPFFVCFSYKSVSSSSTYQGISLCIAHGASSAVKHSKSNCSLDVPSVSSQCWWLATADLGNLDMRNICHGSYKKEMLMSQLVD